MIALPPCLVNNMSTILCSIGQHIAANAEAYSVAAIAFVVSAGKCMPKPGSPFSWGTLYSWLYDTVQSVLPLPRSSSSPTTPVDPATKK